MNNNFIKRHIGPNKSEIKSMLEYLKISSIDKLIEKVIPQSIYSPIKENLIEKPLSETEALDQLKKYSKKNKLYKSYIGMGYYGTLIPNVIKRNILENPGWYTQYTPYQAEISQGRLEALLNFQTMISSATGLPLSNASLLDEATAAAEAMAMFFNTTKNSNKNSFFISKNCHPQTIDVLKTRAEPLGINLIINDENTFALNDLIFGMLLQYPTSDGNINDYTELIKNAKNLKIFTCLATDLLALSILKTPAEMGADAAVGNTQRFGVPMGYGGPHAAFFATTEKFKRKIPGRIIGVSKDAYGKIALRMALQTREQHIRREKATSNICTAQVLLAIISSMYAVYHGPKNIILIAKKIQKLCSELASIMSQAGLKVFHNQFFDTIRIHPNNKWEVNAINNKMNFRKFDDGSIGISLDETTTQSDIKKICDIFCVKYSNTDNLFKIPDKLKRMVPFLDYEIFNKYHSETEMLRYIHKLETKDLSLNHSMIPLGSCTMKLNATTEMIPITWPNFSDIHPFSPKNQTKGYSKLINELSDWLSKLTGFDACSMQPNSGAQGEYAGLLVIRAYHINNGDIHRNICLVPESAHGTNPASAIMAGMKVEIISCDSNGNINLTELKEKSELHSKNLSAIMLTYPSTHGVFENEIAEACEIVHKNGGQVYIDGANLNAMVGICKPGEFGGDVMHINLHKTFCIPHGGGGPGMGPIVCKDHLKEFLPSHVSLDDNRSIPAVSAAPYGSSSILVISWAYIAMLNCSGLQMATKIAILNANYMAKKLEGHYPILFKGNNGFNAHEFIIDLRTIKNNYNINEEDIAKRLMDYGFHAPTMSWPVNGTMMIEPTESESKNELDRFCDALISIKSEILKVENGEYEKNNNPLKNAPHTAVKIASNEWPHPYSRNEAVYPANHLKDYKYWPPVGRIDNASGDRNLVCTCPPIEEYKD